MASDSFDAITVDASRAGPALPPVAAPKGCTSQ